jgi:hypothetical protein
MAFKIKDLMISDLSAEQGALAHVYCGVWQISCIDKTHGYSPTCKKPNTEAGFGAEYIFNPIACDVGTYFYTLTARGTITPLTPVIVPTRETSVTALSALKDQLKQQLAEVEKLHSAAEAGMKPQTVEEVDALTKKLNDALDELKSRRAELAGK